MMSTIVGMYWPGKYSLFEGFDIKFNDSITKKINFSVIKNDKRFRLTKIKFKSIGIDGDISAFFRNKEIQQLKFNIIKEKYF